MDLRKMFDLPEDDLLFLNQYGYQWETIIDQSHWLILHDFHTQHEGYHQDQVLAAILITTGYPKAALDMVYFHPAITREDGNKIGATEHIMTIDNKPFQRWSRHRTGENPWIIGRDNIETHVFLIEDWLLREFDKC